MKFRIAGVTADGAEKTGTITAESENDALHKAKAAGIFVTDIKAVSSDLPAGPPPIAAVSVSTPAAISQTPPEPGEVVVSSGGICAQYDILGLVVGFVSRAEGCGGTIPVESVYQTAYQRLIESAKARGANGLIYVNFQNRVSSQAGCGSTQRVFEVFAWGTAIRF